ncbi:MAG: helix-turn-helix domain-containing protein [Deltaproteobacteria bacterium]|nr:helix-turn-helix domain-containing protein [Deltaproteobacteria bacterium]
MTELTGGPLLSVREVAAVLGVSTATVYALIERGEIVHVRVSNAIRVSAGAIAAYTARSSR